MEVGVVDVDVDVDVGACQVVVEVVEVVGVESA